MQRLGPQCDVGPCRKGGRYAVRFRPGGRIWHYCHKHIWPHKEHRVDDFGA